MPFDLVGARKAGYTDQEIITELSSRFDFNANAAKKSGWSDGEIVEHLSTFDAPTSYRMPKEPPVPEWGKENPNLYGLYGAGKAVFDQLIKPAAEIGGLVAGGIAGTPAGPAGTVGGAGLGYGMAKGATDYVSDKIDRLGGIKKEQRTIPQEFAKAGEDVASGLTMEMAGQGAGKALTGTAEFFSAPYKKYMTQGTKDFVAAAKAKGITPLPADVTGAKSIGLLESIMEKSLASTDIINNARFQKQLAPLMKARSEILESGGARESSEALGKKIYAEVTDFLQKQEGLKGDTLNRIRTEVLADIGTNQAMFTVGLRGKEAAKARSILFRNRAREVYESVGEAIPEGSTFDTPDMLKTAETILGERKGLPAQEGRLKGIMNWAAQELPDDIAAKTEGLPEKIKKSIVDEYRTKRSWDELHRFSKLLKSEIRKETVPMPGGGFQMSEDGRDFTRLLEAVQRDMRDISKQVGGSAWRRLRAADALYKTGADIYKSAEIKKLLKANPEDVITVAFRPEGIQEVLLLKKAVGPTEFLELRKGFTNKLLGVGKSDVFDPKVLRNQVARYGDEMLTQVYGEGGVRALKELAREGLQLTKVQPGTQFLGTLAKTYPQTIVDSIIGAPESKLQSNTLIRNLLTIRKAVSKETFASIGNQLNEKIFALNQQTDLLAPNTFAKTVNKYGRVIRMFNPPEKVAQIKELANIGKRLLKAEQVAGNPSGTAQTLMTWTTLRLMFNNPITGLAVTITPRKMAQLYTSDFGIKWLTEGFRVPATTQQGIDLATKISAIIGTQEEPEGGQ